MACTKLAKKGKLYFLDRYLHEIAKEVKHLPNTDSEVAHMQLMELVKTDIAKVFELHI